MFSVALSSGHPEFALRTTMPCEVRTFLWPGGQRSCTHSMINSKNLSVRCKEILKSPGYKTAKFTTCSSYAGRKIKIFLQDHGVMFFLSAVNIWFMSIEKYRTTKSLEKKAIFHVHQWPGWPTHQPAYSSPAAHVLC